MRSGFSAIFGKLIKHSLLLIIAPQFDAANPYLNVNVSNVGVIAASLIPITGSMAQGGSIVDITKA
jgi:hypothetical protein